MIDWAAKVLEGVERCYVEYDGDMIPSPTGSWICYHEALAAIAKLAEGNGLVERLLAYSSMDDHLSHRSDTERRAAAHIAALTERNAWLSNLSHTAAEKGMKAEAERDALRERVARLECAGDFARLIGNDASKDDKDTVLVTYGMLRRLRAAIAEGDKHA